MPQRPNQRRRHAVDPPDPGTGPSLWDQAWMAFMAHKAARNLGHGDERRVTIEPAKVEHMVRTYRWIRRRVDDFRGDCQAGLEGGLGAVDAPADWTDGHTDRFMLELAAAEAGLSDESRRTVHTFIGGFLRYCARRTDAPWTRSYVPPGGAPKVVHRRQRRTPLSATEEKRLYTALEGRGRDVMLARFLLFTGARLSDALSATVDAIDWQNKTIKVVGKGNKERLLGLVNADEDLSKTLRAFVRERPATDCPYLFLSVRRDAHAQYKRLTRSGAITMFRRLRLATGVDIHAHLLRHTFSQRMADVLPIEDVSVLLGHSRTATTEMIYGRRSMQQALEAQRRRGSVKPTG